MVITEIRSFDEVLLCEMQHNKMRSMSFSQAWRLCERAMPYLPAYGCSNIKSVSKREFVSKLLSTINNLENNGRVTVDRRYGKVLFFTLTESGDRLLSQTIFKNQERMRCGIDN
jgi:lysyl-tRNA synthetase class II